MRRISLGEGVNVGIFSAPSQNFDPLSVSEADLLRHGFPARPSDHKHLERYKQVFGQMKSRFRYLEPEFKINKHRRRGLSKAVSAKAVPSLVGTGNQFNPLWSGGVVYPPPGQSFRWMVGEWTIPNVGAPAENQEYQCLSWIGIDGDPSVESDDLCQVGIYLDVTQSGKSVSRDVGVFSEWTSTCGGTQSEVGPPVDVNFPVTFGDTVIITLCTSGPGATEALAFLANRTSGVGTSFLLYAPKCDGQQVSLVGDSAQWVVERPDTSPLGSSLTPALLADYGQLFFSGCEAVSYSPDGSSSEVVGGGTQLAIAMIEDSGAVLSQGILVADTVVECEYLSPGTGSF
jgi:Peptidase A4 family